MRQCRPSATPRATSILVPPLINVKSPMLRTAFLLTRIDDRSSPPANCTSLPTVIRPCKRRRGTLPQNLHLVPSCTPRWRQTAATNLSLLSRQSLLAFTHYSSPKPFGDNSARTLVMRSRFAERGTTCEGLGRPALPHSFPQTSMLPKRTFPPRAARLPKIRACLRTPASLCLRAVGA